MLIHLQSFGSRLRVRDGIFEVTVQDLSGANNHIKEAYAAHQVKTILLQKGSSISADALLLAIEHGVDVLVLDHFGNSLGRIWSNRPNSTLAIWQRQLILAHTPEGLHIAKEWIEKKLQGRLLFLRKLKGYRKGKIDKVKLITNAEHSIATVLSKLRLLHLHDFDKAAATIRGLEGTAGKYYLDTLSALLPDEYQFEGRSTRPAEDAFNAFLNYGYGILYNKVERSLLMAGLHPYLGFMHADGYQRKNLVFDFIEPFRVWVDKEVFKLFTRKQVSSVHVSLRDDNSAWLEESGRRLIREAIDERFQEKKEDLDGMEYPLERFMNALAKRCAVRVLHGKDQASEATEIMLAG